MARKLIKVSARMLFTWFVLTACILLIAPQSLTNRVQFTFCRLFHWPLSVGRNIALAARTDRSPPDVKTDSEARRANYIANLEEQLREKHSQIEQITGIRNKLRLHQLEGAKFVPAQVITPSIDAAHAELVINQGKNQGLSKGQFVWADNSIIGVISDVDARTAAVRLITDPSSNMPVKLNSLSQDCVMQGLGNYSARIRMLPVKCKVKVGDEIYALKKPGLLDACVIVGRVAKCKPDEENPLLWDITVKPACRIERLETVAVLIMNPKSN